MFCDKLIAVTGTSVPSGIGGFVAFIKDCVGVEIAVIFPCLTLILPVDKPFEVAVIITLDEILSGLTTHNALPLNAFLILLERLLVTSVALPLSVPNIVPPSHEKVISLSAVGTILLFLSNTSHSINNKSSESVLTILLSLINLSLLAP